MEQIKKKLANLKDEKEAAVERAEEAEAEKKETEARADAAEMEVQNLMRKLKLMENDLDTSEDKCADQGEKLKDYEIQMEELTRENKQLNHRINVLEEQESESKVDALAAKLKDSNDECDRLKVENKRLEHQISVLEADLDKAEANYERAKNELEQTLEELKDM